MNQAGFALEGIVNSALSRCMLVAVCLWSTPGSAQVYPAKSIRLIIPFAPGGTNDIVGRVIGQKLGDIVGQQVVPDNRGGAGGTIGMEVAAKAAPDGYSIVIGHIGTLAVNPTLYSKLAYDPVKDFAPITLVSKLPNLMAVNPTVPANTAAEFIALAKARPGKLSYGSGGTGGAGHLATEYFRLLTRIDLVHVPYRGTGLAVIDVISGQLDMVMAGVPAIVPHTRTGKLRSLGVSGSTRLSILPSIPTIAESGAPGYDATQWYGILAPAGTPPAVMAVLHAGLVKALASPEVKERLAADGADPFVTTPEEFTAFMKVEIARWAPVIRKAGLVQ
jgi:tripartite-type tricarboxylate transporter receptor subunit TctC